MSKKTIIFSIVLILIGVTIFESRILNEELVQAETVATISEAQTEVVAVTAAQDSVEVQEWVISVWDDMMQRISEEEGQDWVLMSAIAYNESRFKSNLVSKQGAIGLMQVMPIVGKQFNVAKENIADPD